MRAHGTYFSVDALFRNVSRSSANALNDEGLL